MADSVQQAENDASKLAELAAIVQSVKDRVRARYPQRSGHPEDEHPAVQVALADLQPVLHARDAAQARIASIGAVNPRAGGILNRLIQAVKRMVARALGWFVRDQVTFNREAVSAVEAILEALNDQNRALVSLASQVNHHFAQNSSDASRQLRQVTDHFEGRHEESLASQQRQGKELLATFEARVRELSQQIDARFYELSGSIEPYIQQLDVLKGEAQELKDVRKHWSEWRAGWEQKLATNEVYFLRTAAELQGSFQHRVNQLEATFLEKAKSQHADYLGALDRANLDIQKRLWADVEKIQAEYQRLIHTELRLIRMRSAAAPAGAPAAEPAGRTAQPGPALEPLRFDYSRFAERFRGSEDYVRRNQEFYRPFFEGRENVLDIGCGRGEFLSVMRDLNVASRGIDLGAESISQCRMKGLQAEEADLFRYLDDQPDEEFDGIFSAQVVEHLDPARLPEMIRLCAAKLRRHGILAIETPNPECLAIFATHFFLDPTHTRPVPSPLLAFYMEEAGLGSVQTHKLFPAVDSMPELAELPEAFRNRFFGGLDYAILAWKL